VISITDHFWHSTCITPVGVEHGDPETEISDLSD
jgi:hypothetical protein